MKKTVAFVRIFQGVSDDYTVLIVTVSDRSNACGVSKQLEAV